MKPVIYYRKFTNKLGQIYYQSAFRPNPRKKGCEKEMARRCKQIERGIIPAQLGHKLDSVKYSAVAKAA